MQSISSTKLHPPKIHPALRSFADECTGVLARLIAYVGALALIAIVGISLWNEFELRASPTPARWDWSASSRTQPDSAAKTVGYRASRGDDEIGRPVSLIGLRAGF